MADASSRVPLSSLSGAVQSHTPSPVSVDPATGLLVGGVYTGQIAVRRGEVADAGQVQVAIDRAAAQRVNAYGLPPSAVQTTADYFRVSGAFPDFRSLLQSPGAGPGGGGFVDPAAAATVLTHGGLGGVSQTTWLLAGLAGLALVLVLRKR